MDMLKVILFILTNHMTLWAYVVKIKVKQSHYGPEQTNRVPGV
jgi:hypothetical protein